MSDPKRGEVEQELQRVIERKLREALNQYAGESSEQYPEGKLNDGDEGMLEIAAGVVGENVIINFGKQVRWIGLGVSHAREIGSALLKLADDLEAQLGRAGNDGAGAVGEVAGDQGAGGPVGATERGPAADTGEPDAGGDETAVPGS